jgi:hypothetical protein
MKKYLLLSLVAMIISGCGIVGVYATPEEAMKNQLKDTPDTKANEHFILKRIITVERDFAFFLTPSNNISVAHLKKAKMGWDVTGATGGRDLQELEMLRSGISSGISISNERILYGFLNDNSITAVSYKSIMGHIVDLTEHLPDKQEYKNLKLWYVALPEGQKIDIENTDGLSFKNNKGDIIAYKNK